MLLNYLPLIMLGQLLLLSLFFNMALFSQNRKLIRLHKADEKILFPLPTAENVSENKMQEDHTVFVQQPIFKPEPLFDYQAYTHQAAKEPIASAEPIAEIETTSIPVSTEAISDSIQPEKKSTAEDINRLLNEIAQIEDKMKLKEKAEA